MCCLNAYGKQNTAVVSRESTTLTHPRPSISGGDLVLFTGKNEEVENKTNKPSGPASSRRHEGGREGERQQGERQPFCCTCFMAFKLLSKIKRKSEADTRTVNLFQLSRIRGTN